MILRKSTIFSFLILLVSQLTLIAQPLPPLEFNVTSGMGVQGSTVCLTVTVNNFTNVESIQLNLSYNAALVVPECPKTFTNSALSPNIDSTRFNCNNTANGYINFLWFGAATSIPDGSILFEICFTLIGDPGNISPVYFNGQLLDIEIGQVDNNGNSYNTDEIISNTGTIKIISPNLATFVQSCDADRNNLPAGGKLTFYATGGTPPYNYVISPGGFTGDTGTTTIDGERRKITGIPDGPYILTVTDATGNTSTKQIIISNDGTPIAIDTVVKRPTCFNRRNGYINITNVTGGLSPYTYQWSNLLTGLDSIGSLPINTYTVTITDFNGCDFTETFDLNIDTLKFDLVLKDSASCIGVNDGEITILNARGGTQFGGAYDYKYSLNTFGNPKPFTSPFDITNGIPGLNKVEVIDSLGCVVEQSIIVPFKKTVSFDTMVVRDISCFGKNDGNVRFKASPGTGYGYLLSPNIPGSVFGGVFLVDDLPKGNYTVTARDNAGCTGRATFTINEPEKLIINETLVYPDCANLGSITINPTGGTGAYTYNWTPTAGNVNSLSNLGGGTYSVVVSDANNCQESKSFVFNNVGTLTLLITTKDVSCAGKNDGSAKVAANFPGGNLPMFEIFWRDSNGNILPIKNNTLSNLAPGNYTVQIITTDGCNSGEKPFEIKDGNATTIVTTVTNAPCFGEDGKVEVSLSGNPPGYKFEWRQKVNSNIIDTDNVLNAKAGVYIVKAISPSGCETESEVTITQPNEITFAAPETRNVTCFGLSTGQAAFLTNPLNLAYIWSNGTTAQFVTDLPAGEAWVVGFLGGCHSDTVRFNIGTFPKLEIDQTKTLVQNPTCFGDTNGSVTIEAQGGTGISYTYSWENGSNSPTLSNIPAGTYFVTISDSNNCTQRDSFTLTQPSKLEASIDLAASVVLDCNNQDNGKLAIKTTGGNPGIKTISWQSGVNTNGNVAINLIPGTYCATVSDNFGCKDTICQTLTAPEPLKGKINTPVEPVCYGEKTCISVDYVTGGTGNNYTFQIRNLNNAIRFPLDTCINVFAGQYIVSLIDSAGCSIDTTIFIDQPEPIEVDLGADLEVQLGLSSQVINSFIDAPAGVDTLIWSPFDDLECVSSDCSSVVAQPKETQTYILTVTDVNGCTGSDDVVIKVKNVRNVYFANVFTPNKDGENDFFQAVIGPGVEKILAFNIYDRWGNMVFDKTNYVPDPAGTDGWDGTFRNQKLDPGVFVYTAKAIFIDGKVIDYTGSITLLDKLRN